MRASTCGLRCSGSTTSRARLDDHDLTHALEASADAAPDQRLVTPAYVRAALAWITSEETDNAR
jgi:hypothetical protein